MPKNIPAFGKTLGAKQKNQNITVTPMPQNIGGNQVWQPGNITVLDNNPISSSGSVQYVGQFSGGAIMDNSITARWTGLADGATTIVALLGDTYGNVERAFGLAGLGTVQEATILDATIGTNAVFKSMLQKLTYKFKGINWQTQEAYEDIMLSQPVTYATAYAKTRWSTDWTPFDFNRGNQYHLQVKTFELGMEFSSFNGLFFLIPPVAIGETPIRVTMSLLIEGQAGTPGVVG